MRALDSGTHDTGDLDAVAAADPDASAEGDPDAGAADAGDADDDETADAPAIFTDATEPPRDDLAIWLRSELGLARE
jgi:hypothetical protein